MAEDKTGTKLRGLGIHDPRLASVWLDKSINLTQAEPLPGIPQASGNYDAVIRSSGSMSGNTSLQIYATEGGHPGKESRAGIVWKKSTDNDQSYRGKDPINVITHWEPVRWGDGVTLTSIRPHCVTLSDNTVVAVYRSQVGSDYGVACAARTSAGNWSVGTSVEPVASGQSDRQPCLVLLPDDRLMVYYWHTDTTANTAQIRAKTSTDKGQTWQTISTGLLNTPIDVSGSAGSGNAGFDLGKIRGAFTSGQLLLIGELIDHDTDKLCQYWVQLASNSMGVDFTQVELIESGTYFLAKPEVLASNGQFHIFSIAANAQVIKQIKTSSAFFKLSTLASNSTTYTDNQSAGDYAYGTLDSTSDFLTAGDLAACLDETGNMYLMASAWSGGTSTHQALIYISKDGGKTWLDGGADTTLTNEGGVWWQSLDASTYPTNYTITHCQGRILALTNHAASPGNEDNSLSAFYLGGWSQVTMPDRGTFNDPLNCANWVKTWVPIELPGDMGFSASGTATTETLNSDGVLSIVTGGGGSRIYTIDGSDLTSTEQQGLIVRFSVKCTLGDLTSDSVGLIIRLADADDHRSVSFRLSNTGFRVYDNNAGAALGTTTGLNLGSAFYDFLIAISESNLQVWYRLHGNKSDRQWINALSTSSLNNDTTPPATTNSIKWGCLGGGASSQWQEFHIASGTATGNQFAAGFTNPDDLMPERVGAFGFSSFVDDGLLVNASAGPFRPGDTWTIATKYGYGVDRILPDNSPSPRVQWRSVSTNQQSIAFAFDESLGFGDESNLLGDSLMLCMQGINFKDFEIRGYQAGSGWVLIKSVDTSEGMQGLEWFRHGTTVNPVGSAATDLYLHANELKGATFVLKNTTGAAKYRKITTNSSGLWNATTAHKGKKCTLLLEGIDSTERVSGSDGYIIPDRCCVIMHLRGQRYSAIRVTIKPQATADGYFSIGSMMLGHVSYHGTQYSQSRSVTITPNVTLDTTTDGTTYSRQHGPAARAVAFGWSEGMDTTGLQESGADPDYLQAYKPVLSTGSEKAVASVADVPGQMQGLAEMLGSHKHVVYLPSISKLSAVTSEVFNRRDQFMIARIVSPVTLETVLGDELENEVIRVGEVTLQEMV